MLVFGDNMGLFLHLSSVSLWMLRVTMLMRIIYWMWLSDSEKHLPVGSLVQKTLKSVTVGSLKLRKSSYTARTRSAFGLARNNIRNFCHSSDVDIHTGMQLSIIFADGFCSRNVLFREFNNTAKASWFRWYCSYVMQNLQEQLLTHAIKYAPPTNILEPQWDVAPVLTS